MVTMPSFMKLMQCECGQQYYSVDAKPVECVYCYRKVTKQAPTDNLYKE